MSGSDSDSQSPHNVTPELNRDRIFISWSPENTRSATLATRFQARIFHLHALGFKRVLLAPLKYLILGTRTLKILLRERPKIIFALNPPYFSGLVVWLGTALIGGEFILDSHTGAFLEKKWTWLSPLHRFLVRRAKVSIVTNERLGDIVEQWGGRYFVFGDVPTEFDAQRLENLPRPFVTVVNTFSYDEPIEEVLEAARLLPEVNFSVTGDLKHCLPAVRKNAPPNLRFTGFVPQQDYIDHLFSSDVAVVLTTENYTMQRGAYEAVSLGVPVVTSDWPLLRDTFSGGARFCDNGASGIASAITETLENHSMSKKAVAELKQARRENWASRQAEFEKNYLV